MIKEFKEFIMKGNVLDLAIAVVIGAAFNAIIQSLVNDLIMPIVGGLTAGVDFKDLAVNIMGAQLKYGAFINAIVNFLIVAFVLFIIVKAINKTRRPVVAEVTTKECPYCKSAVTKTATRCPFCTSALSE